MSMKIQSNKKRSVKNGSKKKQYKNRKRSRITVNKKRLKKIQYKNGKKGRSKKKQYKNEKKESIKINKEETYIFDLLKQSQTVKTYYNKVNHIYFYGGVSSRSVQTLKDQIDLINKKACSNINSIPNPIFLHVHSYGGDLFAGIAAMKIIRDSKIPIVSVVDGVSVSAATLMCVAAKYRLIGEYGSMLIHELSHAIWGKFTEMKERYKSSETIMETLKDVYKEYTKVPLVELDQILQRDLFWDADICLKYNLVDAIIKNDNKIVGVIGEETTNRIDIYADYISEEFAKKTVKKIHDINNYTSESRSTDSTNITINISPSPIHIYINSQFAFNWRDSIPIMEAVILSDLPITCTIEGICSNSAVLPVIVSDKRLMYKHGYVQIYKIKDDLGGDISDKTRNITHLRDMVVKIFTRYTKIPQDIMNKILKQELLFNAQECLKYGIIDKVI
jgi:ATP-dependent protease ClpP protease subunit